MTMHKLKIRSINYVVYCEPSTHYMVEVRTKERDYKENDEIIFTVINDGCEPFETDVWTIYNVIDLEEYGIKNAVKLILCRIL